MQKIKQEKTENPPKGTDSQGTQKWEEGRWENR